MSNTFIQKGFVILSKVRNPSSFTKLFSLEKWLKDSLNRYKVPFVSDCTDCANEQSKLTTSQTIGSGAVSTSTLLTKLVTTGAATGTLADGYEGQEKTIFMRTYGGDFVLTPAHMLGGTTITFNSVNDLVKLSFISGNWVVLVNSGCLIA